METVSVWFHNIVSTLIDGALEVSFKARSPFPACPCLPRGQDSDSDQCPPRTYCVFHTFAPVFTMQFCPKVLFLLQITMNLCSPSFSLLVMLAFKATRQGWGGRVKVRSRIPAPPGQGSSTESLTHWPAQPCGQLSSSSLLTSLHGKLLSPGEGNSNPF